MPRGVPKAGKRRRRKTVHVRVPVDHYYCTHCNKEHYKGLINKTKYAKHYVMFRKPEVGKLSPKETTLPKELPPVSFNGKLHMLHPERRSEQAIKVEKFLQARVVGQDHAVEEFVNLTAKIDADICNPFKPRGIYLLLGPTGVGKTRLTEALAEYYFSSRTKMVKFNCGELATMFSFKKFGEKLFTDDNISLHAKNGKPLGIILLDEIEKATILLYKLLMGVLDRASLTIDGQDVDLSHTVILMTSNLGSEAIMDILKKNKELNSSIQSKMRHAALEAARDKFTPEFFNRLDKVVVFNPLLKATLTKIVAMEMSNIEQRLIAHDIRLQCTDLAVKRILEEGTDMRYGARHLNRTLEELIVEPIAHLIASKELGRHSRVKIIAKDGGLQFHKVEK